MLLQIFLTYLLVLQVIAFPTANYTISSRDFGFPFLVPTTESSTSRTPAETNTVTRASTLPIVSSTSTTEGQKPSTTTASTHTHENSDKSSSSSSSSSLSQPIEQTQSSASTTSTSHEGEVSSTGLPPTHIGTTKESKPQSADSSTNGGRQWKIVGITVLCITVAVAAIFLLMSFDSWWGFVRSVFTRRKKGSDMEDLQPDWEKQTWEYGSARQDGPIFPGETEKEDGLAFAAPTVPPAAYSQPEDRHPLEPLFRRPSTRPFPDFKTPSY